jgi:hypothetical protein
MVIFHGELLNNQMVIHWKLGVPDFLNQEILIPSYSYQRKWVFSQEYQTDSPLNRFWVKDPDS